MTAARPRSGGGGRLRATTSPAAMHRWTLQFASPALEAAYAAGHWRRARADTHDWQGASCYLAMVVIGALLLFMGRASDPLLGAGCDPLVLWSAAVPASHLLVIRAGGPEWYRAHRDSVALAYRAAYLWFTSPPDWGLAACAVGAYPGPLPPAAPRQQQQQQHEPKQQQLQPPRAKETPFSALLWRSGVIALWWYPLAFPLLVRAHAPVQALFLAVYAARMPRAACADYGTIEGGGAALRALSGAMGALRRVFAAAHGFFALDGGGGGEATAAAAAEPQIGCVEAVLFLQAAAGALLPTFLTYWAEAHSRRRWLARESAAALQRRRAVVAATGGSAEGASSSATAALPSLPPPPHGAAAEEALLAAALAPPFGDAQQEAWEEGEEEDGHQHPSLGGGGGAAPPGTAADAYPVIALALAAWLASTSGQLPPLALPAPVKAWLAGLW